MNKSVTGLPAFFLVLGVLALIPVHGQQTVTLEGEIVAQENENGRLVGLILIVETGEDGKKEYANYLIKKTVEEIRMRDYLSRKVIVEGEVQEDSEGNFRLDVLSFEPMLEDESDENEKELSGEETEIFGDE